MVKLIGKVSSIADLKWKAKNDPRYAKLAMIAANSLGGNAQTLDQAFRTLELNALETDEASVVGEINFCRDLELRRTRWFEDHGSS